MRTATPLPWRTPTTAVATCGVPMRIRWCRRTTQRSCSRAPFITSNLTNAIVLGGALTNRAQGAKRMSGPRSEAGGFQVDAIRRRGPASLPCAAGPSGTLQGYECGSAAKARAQQPREALQSR